jgi:uncharacterized protein YggE
MPDYSVEAVKMKRKLLLATGLTLAITAMGTVGCETLSPPSSTTKAAESLTGIFSQQSTGIWVSGTGEVTVTPDIASLEVGVEAQEASVSESMAKANEAMDRVMEALDRNGVAEKDIRTRRFRIRQRTSWDDQRQQEVVIGYRVNNEVITKIRDTENVGVIIDAVVAAGGDYTRIDDLSFYVDDPTPYYEEAREKAMADAEAKAKHLADLSDVKLGKVTYVSEGAVTSAVREMIVEIPQMVAPAPAPAITVPPISAGETEVRLTVQVAYSIE